MVRIIERRNRTLFYVLKNIFLFLHYKLQEKQLH